MKGNKQNPSDWVWPPARWWFGLGFPTFTIAMLLVVAFVQFITAFVGFLGELTSQHGSQCYVAGAVMALVGASLIFYAKLPLYRQRRFNTFGVAAIPELRRSLYRWGYRFAMMGCALMVLLLLGAIRV